MPYSYLEELICSFLYLYFILTLNSPSAENASEKAKEELNSVIDEVSIWGSIHNVYKSTCILDWEETNLLVFRGEQYFLKVLVNP